MQFYCSWDALSSAERQWTCDNGIFNQVLINHCIVLSQLGILIAGDFNRLQITRLRNNFQLKQMVHFPTRGRRKLDLILTNISEYYQDPIERPPFGLSDHASIELQPQERAHVKQATITIKERDLHPSKCQKNGHLFGSCGCVHHDLRLRNVRRKGLAPGTDYNNRTWSYSSHWIPKGALFRAPLDYIPLK